jgi:hypothetical protein
MTFVRLPKLFIKPVSHEKISIHLGLVVPVKVIRHFMGN